MLILEVGKQPDFYVGMLWGNSSTLHYSLANKAALVACTGVFMAVIHPDPPGEADGSGVRKLCLSRVCIHWLTVVKIAKTSNILSEQHIHCTPGDTARSEQQIQGHAFCIVIRVMIMERTERGMPWCSPCRGHHALSSRLHRA
jgi:hypothetical protein